MGSGKDSSLPSEERVMSQVFSDSHQKTDASDDHVLVQPRRNVVQPNVQLTTAQQISVHHEQSESSLSLKQTTTTMSSLKNGKINLRKQMDQTSSKIEANTSKLDPLKKNLTTSGQEHAKPSQHDLSSSKKNTKTVKFLAQPQSQA